MPERLILVDDVSETSLVHLQHLPGWIEMKAKPGSTLHHIRSSGGTYCRMRRPSVLNYAYPDEGEEIRVCHECLTGYLELRRSYGMSTEC